MCKWPMRCKLRQGDRGWEVASGERAKTKMGLGEVVVVGAMEAMVGGAGAGGKG